MSGRQFNKLTVLGFSHKDKRNKRYWKCRCSCEKQTEFIVRYDCLINGEVSSCGCLKSPSLSGQRFGKLFVLDCEFSKNGKKYVQCKCDCGNFTTLMKSSLIRAKGSKSCGCLSGGRTHGMSKTSIYSIWEGIFQRCYNKNSNAYKYYGEKGIFVALEWHNFENFYRDMGDRPDNMTIHRKDSSKSYCKENCVWANWETQSNEKTNTHYLTYKNKTKSLTLWAEEYNIKPRTLYGRLKSGYSVEEALNRPIQKFEKRELNGQKKSLGEWAKLYNIPKVNLKSRLKMGWDLEKSLTTPIQKRFKKIN